MTVERFDVIIVGTGSGNAIPADLTGRQIAIVERDVFGGTCVNRGCIPSKMFVYAADRAHAAGDNGRLGLRTAFEGADWPAIVARVFERIDAISESGARYRDTSDTITLIRGTGRFVDHKVLDVEGRRITADTIVLAAGSRPYVPPFDGLDTVDYHTSDTVMRLPDLPPRLVVLGGGYIAAELGHVFDALGSRVTIVNRGDRLLRSEDDDISARFTELAARRYELHLGADVERVEGRDDGSIEVIISKGDRPQSLDADALLVATGRIPNSDLLDLAATGVLTDPAGRVVVGPDLQTAVPGIYALGDLTNHHQLKHVANAEARVVFHNVLHPDAPRHMDYEAVPHAVFSDPQMASVGMTERQAAADAVPFVTAIKEYGATAYGWAMEDTTSFVKVIAHAQTRRLLGAHIIGEQAASLIQVLIQAMSFGQTVDEVANGQLWIHPAITEVVENALLEL
jgi:mycothione reductase